MSSHHFHVSGHILTHFLLSSHLNRVHLLITPLYGAKMTPWRMNCSENIFLTLFPSIFSLWQGPMLDSFKLHSCWLEWFKEAFIRLFWRLDRPGCWNDGYFWCIYNIVSIASPACNGLCGVFYTLDQAIWCIQRRYILLHAQDIVCWW